MDSMRSRILITTTPLWLAALTLCSGCPVWQDQNVPVPAEQHAEPVTGADYWVYVPKDYPDDRRWPLVVTLHGTVPWDTYTREINEWKRLAEDKGFVVVAPSLKSPQGILPVIPRLWFEDLERDERVVLATIDEVCRRHPAVDRSCVLLHGFSAGGYPLLFVGLRNPDRFNMLIGRGINSDPRLLERIERTDEAREMPVVLLWGRDDTPLIRKQCWFAYTYLRERGFHNTEYETFPGAHLRRPDLAYEHWTEVLPAAYRR